MREEEIGFGVADKSPKVGKHREKEREKGRMKSKQSDDKKEVEKTLS
jgi:hypothetical protein